MNGGITPISFINSKTGWPIEWSYLICGSCTVLIKQKGKWSDCCHWNMKSKFLQHCSMVGVQWPNVSWSDPFCWWLICHPQSYKVHIFICQTVQHRGVALFNPRFKSANVPGHKYSVANEQHETKLNNPNKGTVCNFNVQVITNLSRVWPTFNRKPKTTSISASGFGVSRQRRNKRGHMGE